MGLPHYLIVSAALALRTFEQSLFTNGGTGWLKRGLEAIQDDTDKRTSDSSEPEGVLRVFETVFVPLEPVLDPYLWVNVKHSGSNHDA